MKNVVIGASCAAVCAAAGTATAQVIDGTRDASYGAPVAVQTTETQFGDAADPAGFGGGGELNAMYLSSDGVNLYVMVTGNQEPNFNKFNLFIDSKAGGENVLASQGYDFADVASNLGGMTFAPGFEVDYHLYSRWGGGAYEVDFVDRQNGGANVLQSTGAATVGVGTGVQSGVVSTVLTGNGSAVTGPALSNDLQFGFNNTNTAGVLGGTAAADMVAAAAVTTGIELAIPLADLGLSVGDEVRLFAGYGNGDQNFWSNQFLPGLPAPQGNLGGDGNGNFTGTGDIDASRLGFVSYTVVPTPASAALLGLGALAGIRRRR